MVINHCLLLLKCHLLELHIMHLLLSNPKFWTAKEKKTRKIDRLLRSLLIQGLPYDIYSLIASNETAKDSWDALERQMRGSEDVNDALGYKKKAVVVTLDPLALVAEKTNVSKGKEKVVVSSDSKKSGLDDFSELKKITALLVKDFNRRKFYSKPTNNNLRTSSTSQSANKKQEFIKSDDKKVEKKADEKKRDMSKVKCYNFKKEGYFAKECKKAKVKDYNYYKTKMLLAKKDSNEQVFLAEDQSWMKSSSDSDQEINTNMVFMAQIEKVLSESGKSSLSGKETIAEINFEDDYFQEIINLDFEKIDSPLQQTSSLKPYVLNVILEKITIDLEDEVVNLLEKEKANLKTIKSLKSKDSFSSVRRPKNNDVIWKKKGSSNTFNVGLSAVSLSKLNKNVKRYSRKDLLSCNNSHLGETSSAYVCNDVMNVSCNPRMCDLLDDNNFFIVDDEGVKFLLLARCLLGKSLVIL
nr:hypothetical protein [Tanacetum cinerariifolium]